MLALCRERLNSNSSQPLGETWCRELMTPHEFATCMQELNTYKTSYVGNWTQQIENQWFGTELMKLKGKSTSQKFDTFFVGKYPLYWCPKDVWSHIMKNFLPTLYLLKMQEVCKTLKRLLFCEKISLALTF